MYNPTFMLLGQNPAVVIFALNANAKFIVLTAMFSTALVYTSVAAVVEGESADGAFVAVRLNSLNAVNVAHLVVPNSIRVTIG